MTSNSAPSPQDCAAMLLEVIPAVMRTIRARMRAEASVELTVVQFRALAKTDRHGGASVSEIAEHVGLTMPSASKLVQGLVGRGYLRRRKHPNDRRISILVSTGKGHRAMESARRATRRHLAELLRGVPRGQRAQIAAAMNAIRPVFQDTPPPTTAIHGRANDNGMARHAASRYDRASHARPRGHTTTWS